MVEDMVSPLVLKVSSTCPPAQASARLLNATHSAGPHREWMFVGASMTKWLRVYPACTRTIDPALSR
jgi:hypothetical protein